MLRTNHGEQLPILFNTFQFLGLDSIIRNIILEKIEERLVWPNKQTKILRTRIRGKHHMKCYESAGVLR